MPVSKYDKLFGGAGSAQKARESMRKTYGSAKKGDTVFWATVFKREQRAKRAGARKTKARRS